MSNTLDSHEEDLNTLLSFIKVNLLSENNDLLLSTISVIDKNETPEKFWRNMFPTQSTVPVSVFANAIRLRTSCDESLALHISGTIGSDGLVHAGDFFSKFDDLSSYFDISMWVRELQNSSPSRTVSIPAHVRKIHKLLVHDTYIISCSKDYTIKIFEFRDVLILRNILVGHENDVTDFCVKDCTIFSGSIDETIREWDLLTGVIKGIYAVKEPIHMVCSLLVPDTILYVSNIQAYPIVIYDMKKKLKVRRIYNPTMFIYGVVTMNKSIVIVNNRNIRQVAVTGEEINFSNFEPTNKSVCAFGDCLLTGYTQGIKLSSFHTQKTVQLVDKGSCSIKNISIHDRTDIFVLWETDKVSYISRIDSVDLLEIKRIKINLGKEILSTMTIQNDTAFVATNSGNIAWVNVNTGEMLGSTLNRNMTLGLGFTKVRVVTCELGILVCDKNVMNLWRRDHRAIIESKIDYNILDATFQWGKFHVLCQDNILECDPDLQVTRIFKPENKVHRLLTCRDKILFLSSDDNTSNWNLSICSENKEINVLSEISFTTVVTSTTNHVILSDTENITIIDAQTFSFVYKKKFQQYTKHSIVSGCIFQNDTIYTLHSNSEILVWDFSTQELYYIKKLYIDPNVVELAEFSGFILGFTLIGSINVYDDNLNILKRIVSHKAREIRGISDANNTKEVILSDQTGVIQVLAEISDDRQKRISLTETRNQSTSSSLDKSSS